MALQGGSRWYKVEDLLVTSKTHLDNTPDPASLANLHVLMSEGLDPIVDAIGTKPTVTSGYRSPSVNAAVGGSSTSDHPKGLAADLRPPAGWTSGTLARAAVDALPSFDQVIAYAPERGGHVHVGMGPRRRGQVLTMLADGRYVSGIQVP